MSLGILENGTLVFRWGLRTGSGGNGGESWRVVVAVTAVTTFAGFDSDSDSESLLDDDSEEEGVIFLGASESVALVSELTIGFLFASSDEDSLSDSDEESELESDSESGNGVF